MRSPRVVCRDCTEPVAVGEAFRLVSLWARADGRGGTLSGVRAMRVTDTFLCRACIRLIENPELRDQGSLL